MCMTWADTAMALTLCKICKAGEVGQSLCISVNAASGRTMGVTDLQYQLSLRDGALPQQL